MGLLTVSLGRDINTYHSCSYVYLINFVIFQLKLTLYNSIVYDNKITVL